MTIASVVGSTGSCSTEGEQWLTDAETFEVITAQTTLLPKSGQRVFRRRHSIPGARFEIFEMATAATPAGWNRQILLDVVLPSIFTLLTLLCLTHLVMLVIDSNPARTSRPVLSAFTN